MRAYKETIDQNYGRIPDGRDDLWRVRRNYLINAMRLVDAEFLKILEAMDRQNFWENTVVLFMGDHGEMNGAHRMAQKGAIPFDEAAVVNLTVCAPGGPRGRRTPAVGSHLDLAPTLLEFAGLDEEEIRTRYPHLKGRSLRSVIIGADDDGPRGSRNAPGEGALVCWDGLNMLDYEWALTGALMALTDMGGGPRAPKEARERTMEVAGAEYGAPDFSKRTFYRAVVDGRYKLVRWFSPEEYGNPATVEDLYATGDVALYDLESDPRELENLAHPEHPQHDPAAVQRMLVKLHSLIEHELGDEQPPFDLNLFGTRELKYRGGGI